MSNNKVNREDDNKDDNSSTIKSIQDNRINSNTEDSYNHNDNNNVNKIYTQDEQTKSIDSNIQSQGANVSNLTKKQPTETLTTKLEYLNSLEYKNLENGVDHLVSLSLSEGYLLNKAKYKRLKDNRMSYVRLKCRFHRLSKRKKGDNNNFVPCPYSISIGHGVRGRDVFKVNVSNCSHNHYSMFNKDKEKKIDNNNAILNKESSENENKNTSVINQQNSTSDIDAQSQNNTTNSSNQHEENSATDDNNQPRQINSVIFTVNDNQTEHITTNQDSLNKLEFPDIIEGVNRIVSLAVSEGYLLVKSKTDRIKNKSLNHQGLKCKFYRKSSLNNDNLNYLSCPYKISIGRKIRGSTTYRVNVINCKHNHPPMFQNEIKKELQVVEGISNQSSLLQYLNNRKFKDIDAILQLNSEDLNHQFSIKDAKEKLKKLISNTLDLLPINKLLSISDVINSYYDELLRANNQNLSNGAFALQYDSTEFAIENENEQINTRDRILAILNEQDGNDIGSRSPENNQTISDTTLPSKISQNNTNSPSILHEDNPEERVKKPKHQQ
ncbi:hypothetical protein K502DRAFT_343499 [Neoconidiobolus thromboides FSU 785]|nr:hypothetical protein K502DRAFT_343499 [Neoconidiobolus thromboides FSU 785]